MTGTSLFPRPHWAFRILKCWTTAAIMLLVVTSLARADIVAVSGKVDDGYGTITFRWPTAVPFRLSQQGSALTINFGRSITRANFAPALKSLSGYLEAARIGEDRSSVILRLKKPFESSGYDAAEAVTIFFVGDPVSGATPAGKEKLSSAPPTLAKSTTQKSASLAGSGAKAQSQDQGAPVVRIRTGLHDAYTRVVFDFERPVPYAFSNQSGVVQLDFEGQSRFNLNQFQKSPPRLIGGARARYGDQNVSVTFAVPKTSQVRHFRLKNKVVLDIRNPSGSITPVALPKLTPNVAEEGSKIATPRGPSNPETVPKPAPELKLVETIGAGDASGVKETAQDTVVADKKAPISLTPPERQNAVTGARGVYGESPEILNQFQDVVTSQAEARRRVTNAEDVGASSNAATLRFDWAEPVGAAVFRRAGPLWVVFDKYQDLDTEALKDAGGNTIRSIEQVLSPHASVLRIETLSGINPNLKRDGFAWILEFRKQELMAQQSIEVTPQLDSPVGPRIFVSVPEPGEPTVLVDPDVGDTIVVTPVIPLAHGIGQNYRYPELQILKTAQGVVVKPWTDDIRVRSLRQGVEITAPGPLNISEVAPDLAANLLLQGIRPLSRIFDADKWRQGDDTTYVEDRRGLYQRIATATNDQAGLQARLDLARFYFANRFAPETLGVLRVTVEGQPSAANDPEIILMQGAANVLLGRYVEAAEFLAQPLLDGNDEAIFWRSILVAKTGALPVAAEELIRTGATIRPYPRALKVPLGLVVAEAAVELGDSKSATHYLGILEAEGLTPSEQQAVQFINGRLAALGGSYDDAISQWEDLLDGDNRWIRARAAVAKIELLKKLQRFDAAEALEEMEALRFAWRGDDFEFKMLRQMGDLYLSVGDYRNGLSTLRQAATHFRQHEDAPQVTRQMAEAFQALYLDGVADDLAPVTAIALYDEFKELTPAGSRGDQMIQHLAERLVDADLLDRAAELLEGQVQFRLKDAEKARVGARLSLVYVMADRYEDALDALERTKSETVPSELRRQRRLIQARALIGLQRQNEALALLNQDDSLDSLRLRSIVNWNQKDWPTSSQTLREVLMRLNTQPRRDLTDEQMRYILKHAIALTLAGNERGVARLNQDHGEQMLAGPLAEAFQLIIRGPENGLIDYRTIADKVGAVQTFQTFLSSMKDRLRTENASAYN